MIVRSETLNRPPDIEGKPVVSVQVYRDSKLTFHPDIRAPLVEPVGEVFEVPSPIRHLLHISGGRNVPDDRAGGWSLLFRCLDIHLNVSAGDDRAVPDRLGHYDRRPGSSAITEHAVRNAGDGRVGRAKHYIALRLAQDIHNHGLCHLVIGLHNAARTNVPVEDVARQQPPPKL